MILNVETDAPYSGIHGFLDLFKKRRACFQQTKSIKITFHQINIPFIQHSTVSSPWRQACWQIIGTSPRIRWCGIFITVSKFCILQYLNHPVSTCFFGRIKRIQSKSLQKTTFETSPFLTGNFKNTWQVPNGPKALRPFFLLDVLAVPSPAMAWNGGDVKVPWRWTRCWRQPKTGYLLFLELRCNCWECQKCSPLDFDIWGCGDAFYWRLLLADIFSFTSLEDSDCPIPTLSCSKIEMSVSKNSGIPKWMVYNGKPYI